VEDVRREFVTICRETIEAVPQMRPLAIQESRGRYYSLLEDNDEAIWRRALVILRERSVALL